MQTFKIVLTVPSTHTEEALSAIGTVGGGQFDQTYDFCAFVMRGEGRFRPLIGSHPKVGKMGQIAQVIEDRIEVTVTSETLPVVIEAIRRVHPYEVPVIDVYPLLNLTQ